MFAECANLGCLVAFHWGLSPQTPRQGGLRPLHPRMCWWFVFCGFGVCLLFCGCVPRFVL
jgi:hypothetical protein